jgi:hypothetical protein
MGKKGRRARDGSTPSGSTRTDAERISRELESPKRQVFVILFIPSLDRDEKELKTRDLWADAALDLFAELFGGATAFETYAGIYPDKVRGQDLRDKPILLESYTDIERIRDIENLNNLVSFMKRMGKETRQAAAAVVIDNAFHELTEF